MHLNRTLAGVALAAALAAPALAQDYPNRPVRMLSPFPAGNVNDGMVRMVGDRFQKETGQPFVYDYRPGGAGVIAAQALTAAPADGYTLLMGTSGMLAINPHTYTKLPYDPFRDFAPITLAIGTQMIFAAHGTLAPGSLAEFVAHAKSLPGKLAFASFTAGNPSHFAGVILNQAAGLDLTHIPYKGSPPATQDLLAGQVATAFLPVISVKQHVESGRLKAYAVTGRTRSALMPGVPTFREQGFPQMEIYIWTCFVAPAGTPAAVIERLNRIFVAALGDADVQAKLRTIDLESMAGTPAEMTRYLRADYDRWAGAVKASGFRAD